jgi:photosystem II stability/assembly factor-like uncharacterized protein
MRFPPETVLLTVLAAAAAWAQEQPPVNLASPVLENSGKPMVLPFRCTEDDVQWAGMTCSADEPCPVYLELAAVESGVPSGSGRIFAAGNIHSSAVTLYSVLLASEDAGHTWREAYERIRGASLDHIQFFDAELGWISGQALSPLPQDPFLLLTSDGGKKWRQRVIFSESRVGSIQQFHFGAKDSGSLIVDRGPGAEGGRYELYESPDAGETWTIRETSDRPFQLKPSPVAPTSEWRARADGPTQSFHLERRQGELWVPVAAFAVKLGACQP